jgi:hypothetical protein
MLESFGKLREVGENPIRDIQICIIFRVTLRIERKEYMPLPDSYTLKPNSIPAYFDAILDAHPPDRFSVKFLENLGFTSTNDRLFVGILKELGFLNADGTPQQRYFEFMDRSRSKQVLAEGIREAYSDLFAINRKANELNVADIKNKLRTLYGQENGLSDRKYCKDLLCPM